MGGVGLSNEEALRIVVEDARLFLSDRKKIQESRPFLMAHNGTPSTASYCELLSALLLVFAVMMMIGSVDMENNVDWFLFSVSSGVLLYCVLQFLFQRIQYLRKKKMRFKAVENMIDYVARAGNLTFSANVDPVSEEMTSQLCMRNGQKLCIPRLLIARGDLLLLRPGQISPCQAVTEEGRTVERDEYLERESECDKATGCVNLLEPLQALANESPIVSHLEKCISKEEPSDYLDRTVHWVIHDVADKVIPSYLLLVVGIVLLRFLSATSDSLYGTRYVFSIPAITILPLLCPTLPMAIFGIRLWNIHVIEDQIGSSLSRDILPTLGTLTGVSVVDKKGVLSSSNPCLDKVVIFRKGDNDVVPETLDLSSELTLHGHWRLYFDDPQWYDAASRLRPVALSTALNGCSQNQIYAKFLDHLATVSASVPRTIVAASRRCICQLPALLQMEREYLQQFLLKEPQILRVYQRTPGDAPVPGLTKHRTPLEVAFATLYEDSSASNRHLFCQGTANLLLGASSHVWTDDLVQPISNRLSRLVKDIYQRNSMTGYCLALSYKATKAGLREEVERKLVELPLQTPINENKNPLIRSVSSVELNENEETGLLSTAREVSKELFTDQVLVGLTVMQYEALPAAVQFVDRLESDCVRFVYFSRENELRSRVFAEKLGLEAGWNCHISLAEPEAETEPSLRRFVQHMTLRKFADGRRSHSDEFLPIELGFRISPIRRHSSTTSDKVGPMPNKAQLPTGISQVRPHLENIDNVPLLVSLFSDSDVSSTAEMINIMRENGEVVATIGSALNTFNIDIFSRSDVSFSIMPIPDQSCGSSTTSATSSCLAGQIMGLSADCYMLHDQLLSLPDAIRGSRHRLALIKTSLLFFLLSSSFLSLSMLLSQICFLPALFTSGQMLLTTFIHLPLLLIGTVWTPFLPRKSLVRIANKDTCKDWGTTGHAVGVFLIQFAPTAVMLNILFLISLTDSATMLCSFSDVVCFLEGEDRLSTNTIRHVIAFHTIIYLCALSSMHVYPLVPFWRRVPFISPPWIFCSSLCVISQIAYSYLLGESLFSALGIRGGIIILSWSILIIIICEFCKRRNSKIFFREQRRAKLAFDTKLGMNSPY